MPSPIAGTPSAVTIPITAPIDFGVGFDPASTSAASAAASMRGRQNGKPSASAHKTVKIPANIQNRAESSSNTRWNVWVSTPCGKMGTSAHVGKLILNGVINEA